jgi:hypothetical protein
MRMPYVAVVCILSALSACTSSTQTYTPDGSVGYTLSCFNDWGGCFAKAGDLCKSRGYTVIDRHEEKHAYGSGNSATWSGGTGQISPGFAGTESTRTMLIKCNA